MKGTLEMALSPHLPAEVTLELAKAFFKVFSPRYRFFKALGDKCPRQEQRRRGDDGLEPPPIPPSLPSLRPMGLGFYLCGSDPYHTRLSILYEEF